MTVGWNAGSVRARALAARRAGRARVRTVAAAPSLDAGISHLADTVYRAQVPPGQDLEAAQRAITARIVWLLRVLAGWFPRDGAAVLRVLAGPAEIANTADHLQRLAGGTPPPPIVLGRLGTCWSRLAATTGVGAVRAVLKTSVWGEPGGDEARDVLVGMRLSLADRVIAAVPDAASWASGAVALLLARELAFGRSPRATVTLRRVLGAAVLQARTPADVVRAVNTEARWVFADLPHPLSPQDLWQAELTWWARVERDSERLARHRTPGPQALVGSVGLLVTDAWRVRAALEVAARGGGTLEDLDAAV